MVRLLLITLALLMPVNATADEVVLHARISCEHPAAYARVLAVLGLEGAQAALQAVEREEFCNRLPALRESVMMGWDEASAQLLAAYGIILIPLLTLDPELGRDR